MSWLRAVIERAKAAADRGPAPMKKGKVRHGRHLKKRLSKADRAVSEVSEASAALYLALNEAVCELRAYLRGDNDGSDTEAVLLKADDALAMSDSFNPLTHKMTEAELDRVEAVMTGKPMTVPYSDDHLGINKPMTDSVREVIELVAAAIYENFRNRNRPWDDLIEPERAPWLQSARAAIEALEVSRKPPTRKAGSPMQTNSPTSTDSPTGSVTDLIDRAIALIEQTPIGDLASNIRPRLSWEQKRDEAQKVIAGLEALRSTTPVTQVPPLERLPHLEPREFLLLASYCGTDNDACTDARPCPDCLAMCNVFDADGAFLRELAASPEHSPDRAVSEPIPMLLFCPRCHAQHVDEPDERTPDWTNPPHRSHLCHACGCIWRPADAITRIHHSMTNAGD